MLNWPYEILFVLKFPLTVTNSRVAQVSLGSQQTLYSLFGRHKDKAAHTEEQQLFVLVSKDVLLV